MLVLDSRSEEEVTVRKTSSVKKRQIRADASRRINVLPIY